MHPQRRVALRPPHEHAALGRQHHDLRVTERGDRGERAPEHALGLGTRDRPEAFLNQRQPARVDTARHLDHVRPADPEPVSDRAAHRRDSETHHEKGDEDDCGDREPTQPRRPPVHGRRSRRPHLEVGADAHQDLLEAGFRERVSHGLLLPPRAPRADGPSLATAATSLFPRARRASRPSRPRSAARTSGARSRADRRRRAG